MQVEFTEIKSVSTTQTKTKSISVLILKPSDLRPAFKNRVNFDHHPHKNQVNRSLQLKMLISARTRSISIPRTKNESLSIPTLKPTQIWCLLYSSQFRCLHTKTKLISIHTLKPSVFRPPYWNQVNFDPYTEITSISIPHINQANFDPNAKTMSILTPTQNQTNSDPRTKNKSLLITF